MSCVVRLNGLLNRTTLYIGIFASSAKVVKEFSAAMWALTWRCLSLVAPFFLQPQPLTYDTPFLYRPRRVQAIVPYDMPPFLRDMTQHTPDKVMRLECHNLTLAITVVKVAKDYLVVTGLHDLRVFKRATTDIPLLFRHLA